MQIFRSILILLAIGSQASAFRVQTSTPRAFSNEHFKSLHDVFSRSPLARRKHEPMNRVLGQPATNKFAVARGCKGGDVEDESKSGGVEPK